MIVVLNKEKPIQKFSVPEFEKNIEFGVPKVSSNYEWKIIETPNFLVGICGNIYLDKEKVTIYFSNPKENNVWLKLRMLDENGEIYGETGILKPDEYVESIYIKKAIDNLSFKVMAYEPETYYSQGSIIINSNIVK